MTVEEQAGRARAAALILSRATRAAKDAALHAMADALGKAETAVLEANARDVERAEAAGTGSALIDRLRLTADRIAEMTDGLRDLAALPDPVGDVVRGWTNANGVQVRQVRVPFGVVGIIYEARPNVTADAAGICLKSGNAVLLRGSSSAADSNAAIVEALQAGLVEAGLPADAIQLVPGPREVTQELMAARGLVDVLIPRGGAGLIDTVVRNSQVPVIETGVGNCHLFVDADRRPADGAGDPAQRQDPTALGVQCRRDPAGARQHRRFLCAEGVAGARRGRGDGARGLPGGRATGPSCRPRRPTSPRSTCRWTSRSRSSTRSTPRCTTSAGTAPGTARRSSPRRRARPTRFTAEVDAAAVLVNASSRFVDGGEFGFGAEIGISTQKLHARGPMGLPEMTSTKYVLVGSGQIRGLRRRPSAPHSHSAVLAGGCPASSFSPFSMITRLW